MRNIGRPKKDEPSEKTKKVTVILDEELLLKFEELPRPPGLKGRGWRSVLLRRLIEQEYERVKK